MLWIAISIILGILIIDLIIHIVFAFIVLSIFEHKPPFNVEHDPESPLAEKISISTTDSLTLKGNLFRPSNSEINKLVLFCPEFEGSQWSSFRYCHGLIQAGFHVISFDFRNQGESDSLKDYTPLHWMSNYELEDVLSVVDYIKDDPELSKLELGIFGVSRGGSAAIAASAFHPEIKQIATEGLYSTASLSLHFAFRWASLFVPSWILKYIPVWHLSATLFAARRLCGFKKSFKLVELEKYLPKLSDRSFYLIMGGKDTYVEPQISKRLLKYTGTKAEVLVVANASHNMSRMVEPEEYDQRLVSFFMENPDPSFSEKEVENSSLSAEKTIPDHKI